MTNQTPEAVDFNELSPSEVEEMGYDNEVAEEQAYGA